MPATPADELKIKDPMVKTLPQLTPQGQTSQKIVTFYVSEHGPFTLVYDAAKFSVDQVRADMNKQLVELQTIARMTA